MTPSMILNQLPVSIYGLGWNDSTQNPCLYLRGGVPESELIVDLDSIEAAQILRYVDRVPNPSPTAHDLVVQLFVRNGYLLEFLFLDENSNGDLVAVLHCRKGPRKEEWPLSTSDGLALAMRMHFPVYIHPDAFVHRSLPLGMTSYPDVLC